MRELTLGLYLLRCSQMGLSVADLAALEEGSVIDMMIERSNDSHEYPKQGTAEDFHSIF